jgi:hypothetical protein
VVLELIFEADLQPEQYAYRRDRSALDAVKRVHKLIYAGHQDVKRKGGFLGANWIRSQPGSHTRGDDGGNHFNTCRLPDGSYPPGYSTR